MKTVAFLLLSASLCFGDKPAVAPAYEAPAPETYGAPVAPVAKQQDSYGSPSAPVKTVVEQDSYGSPQAAPIQQDSYGSPAAPPKTQYQAQAPPQHQAAAPVGNQGYYYYYYPVRQSAPVAAESEDDDSIIGLVTALLTKKIVLIALGLGAFLLATAVGININFGRSFARSLEDGWQFVGPYMTEDNLITLADFVNKSIGKFQ